MLAPTKFGNRHFKSTSVSQVSETPRNFPLCYTIDPSPARWTLGELRSSSLSTLKNTYHVIQKFHNLFKCVNYSYLNGVISSNRLIGRRGEIPPKTCSHAGGRAACIWWWECSGVLILGQLCTRLYALPNSLSDVQIYVHQCIFTTKSSFTSVWRR